MIFNILSHKRAKLLLFAAFMTVCMGVLWFHHPLESDEARELIPSVKIINARYNTRSSLEIEWKKQKNVDGYIIYAWDRDGMLKSHKRIKNPEASSGIIDDLSYNTPYRFAVAAYITRDDAIQKGSYDRNGFRTKIKVTAKYKNGYRYFYDWNDNIIKDHVTDFLKKNPRYQIRTNTHQCVTTVYAADDNGEFNTPVRAWLCSPGIGRSTATGVWNLGEKYRYRPLLYGTNSQWAVRIHDEILFHTCPYRVYGTNNTLDVAEYNKLGTRASHGCIRMQCEAVQWISLHCPEGTEVVIYESDDPGGFGKPELEPLPSWHTWDPTDPTAAELCDRNNCHQ